MKKELKDYLHLYVGCKFVMKIRDTENLTAQMTFGVEALCATFSGKRQDLINPILILRPLSDMQQEDADELWELLGWNERIKGLARLDDIMREFTYIESDEGGNSQWGYLCNILPYLLKHSFDLFGLIESGLAIDATTMPDTVKIK